MKILKKSVLAFIAIFYLASCTQTEVNPSNSTTPNSQKAVSLPVSGLTEATYNEAFEITEKQRTQFANGQEITFVKVLADSRCPEGTVCVDPGYARVRLTFNAKVVDLTLSPMVADVNIAYLNGYILHLLSLSSKESGTYKAKVLVRRNPVVKATYDEAFEITEKQQTQFANGQEITFVKVLADSRCPEGTVCVDPGYARVRLTFNAKVVDLTLSPMVADVNIAYLNGYTLHLLSLSSKESGTYKAKVLVRRNPVVKATYDEAFEITEKQQAQFANDQKVTFVKVLADSRCPEGAVCVDPGYARVRLTFNAKVVDLTLSPMVADANIAYLNGYTLHLIGLSSKEKGAYEVKAAVYKN